MKNILLIAALVSLTAGAAPRARGYRVPHFDHPTNSTEVLGVKMPPRYTPELWERREALREEWMKKMQDAITEIDTMAAQIYEASLTQTQKEALAAQSASNEVAAAQASAKAIRRQWEIEGITNRLAWVKKEWKDKRRIEREYHPGLKWMDSEIVKETITIAESGKVRIHFLYTADGKKHRFDPDAITDQLAREALRRKMDTIIVNGGEQ